MSLVTAACRTAPRFSKYAALTLIAGAATRAVTRREGDRALFLSVTLAVIACSLVVLAIQTRWPPHTRPRSRVAAVACLRLAIALLGAVPFPIPEAPSTSCPGYAWYWLTNSGAIAAFFLSLAATLPSTGANVLLGAVQVAALAWVGGVRCEVLGQGAPPPGVSLLAADPGRCLIPLAQTLDWPFHMTFPHAMLDAAAELSPRAACLACTLWAQAVCGLLVPVVLLCNWSGAVDGRGHSLAGADSRWAAEAAPVPAAPSRARRRWVSGGDGSNGSNSDGGDPYDDDDAGDGTTGARPVEDSAAQEGGAWADAWIREQPVLCTVFAAQMLWMLGRTVCAYSLPRASEEQLPNDTKVLPWTD